jgi:ATP-dependent Clp protease ATP-binding subunit ClpA
MTSNAGAREMNVPLIGFAGAEQQDTRVAKGMKAVENLFSPEFRNRLDGIIPFNGLSLGIMERIVDKFLKEVEEQLAEKNIRFELSSGARRWLAESGYDSNFGARPLARFIQSEIKDILADEILFGKLVKGGRVRIYRPEDASPEDSETLRTENLVFQFPDRSLAQNVEQELTT